MICPSCRQQIADNVQNCPFCGTQVAQNYQQAQPQQQYAVPPRPHLESNRGLVKFILLSFITCGIYAIIAYYKITEDINTICRPYDNKTTMNYLVATLLLGPVTCGIYPIIWMHNLCNRIGDNLKHRGLPESFGAGTFWGWGVLGSLIVIGPLVFLHKFLKATNSLAADYNARG